MNGELSIPPLRELPAGRLEQLSHHLRAEARLARPSLRLRPALAVTAILLALAAALLATPAFGLRDRIAHLFGAGAHPPELIVRYFRNQNSGRGSSPPVLASKARVALVTSIHG